MAYIWPWSDLSKNCLNLEFSENVILHSKRARDMRITSFAIGIIALFLMGISHVLFGLGTLPPTALFGMGMFPYLGGTFLSFVAVGLVGAAIVCIAISGVHTWQKAKWISFCKTTGTEDFYEPTQ